MKIDGDKVIYSSGRTNYFPGGIIGLSPDLVVQHSYGTLGDIPRPNNLCVSYQDNNCPNDNLELADYMISQWTKYRDSILNLVAGSVNQLSDHWCHTTNTTNRESSV
jgi:hypothetical protein